METLGNKKVATKNGKMCTKIKVDHIRNKKNKNKNIVQTNLSENAFRKHMETPKVATNNDIFFICYFCDYKTNKKWNFKKHIQTQKHIQREKYENIIKSSKIKFETNTKHFFCTCGKKYKSRSGIYKHKLTCTIVYNEQSQDSLQVNEYDIKPSDNLTGLIHTLIQENKDLTNKIVELSKEPRIINNNIRQQNNINILNYLNNECEEALNLTDFVRDLKINFSDLMLIKDNGFVYGLENTFINGLKQLEQTKRPIHCTDKKRRKFYVKEDNKWEKDNQHEKITNAIKKVSSKQCEVLQQWKQQNEDWLDNDKKHDNVNEITSQICKVYTEDGEKLKNKVIGKLSSLSLFDK